MDQEEYERQQMKNRATADQGTEMMKLGCALTCLVPVAIVIILLVIGGAASVLEK